MAKKKLKISNVSDYLPLKTSETQNIQVDIDVEIYERTKAQMKADGLKWRDLVEGLFLAYLEDRGRVQ